jgi:4-amino-4-deoxy-L-arabinose transferase-like glycosyltransferase
MAVAAPPNEAVQPGTHWFVPALTAVTLLGITWRIVYVVVWADGTKVSGDPQFFQQTAARLAHGGGYNTVVATGGLTPTARHPPVFSILLAVLDLLKIQSVDAHRLVVALISAGAVVFMGLLGRRLMGPGVGLVAATIAAVSPLWVQWGGRLLSESVYLVVVPLVLLAALRCVDRPSWWAFSVAGVAIGVATLTRSEAVWFVVVLGVPLVFLGPRTWRTRVRYGLVFLAGFVIVVGPWLVRNEVQLGGLTLSTDGGYTLAGAYTASTFSPSSPFYGSFDGGVQYADIVVLVKWGKPPNHAKTWTELALQHELGQTGTTYALGHLNDLPGVVLAREGRLWGVYAIGSQLQYDAEEGGQVRGFYVASQFLEWISLPLAIAGGVVLGRRSRRRLIVVLAPIVVAALNAALFYGSTRLRVIAEPSLFLLTSIALVAAFHWFGASLRQRSQRPLDPALDESLQEII